jgi:hypothetical protein
MIPTTTFTAACAVDKALERLRFGHGAEQHDGLAGRAPRHGGIRAIPNDPDGARPFPTGAPDIVVGFGHRALQATLPALHSAHRSLDLARVMARPFCQGQPFASVGKPIRISGRVHASPVRARQEGRVPPAPYGGPGRGCSLLYETGMHAAPNAARSGTRRSPARAWHGAFASIGTSRTFRSIDSSSRRACAATGLETRSAKAPAAKRQKSA